MSMIVIWKHRACLASLVIRSCSCELYEHLPGRYILIYCSFSMPIAALLALYSGQYMFFLSFSSLFYFFLLQVLVFCNFDFFKFFSLKFLVCDDFVIFKFLSVSTLIFLKFFSQALFFIQIRIILWCLYFIHTCLTPDMKNAMNSSYLSHFLHTMYHSFTSSWYQFHFF